MPRDSPTLVSCFDRSYLPHLATAVRSVALSGSAVDRWYLFYDESVSAEARDALLAFTADCRINAECRSVPDDLLVGFPANRPSSPLVWLRPLLGELLPDEDRVLSLDCDTLVLHDLGRLWRTGLKEASYFAAVTQPVYRLPDPLLEQLGIGSSTPYFNAGVMLMDLALMRSEDLAGKTRAFAASSDRPELPYNEQDALNILFPGRWTALDPTWNAMTAILMPFVAGATWSDELHHEAWVLERAARSPAVVHFEGAAQLKPWRSRCFNPFAPLYRQLRNTTPWPLRDLEGGRRDALIARAPARAQFTVWLGELKVATARQRLSGS